MEAETEYYGLYALKDLLEWPALRLVLRRRKQVVARRTIIFSGAAQTGKTIALHLLPSRLPEFKMLLVTLPPQKAPGRKITWRPFLLSILAACGQPSTTHGPQALLEEVLERINPYDLVTQSIKWPPRQGYGFSAILPKRNFPLKSASFQMLPFAVKC